MKHAFLLASLLLGGVAAVAQTPEKKVTVSVETSPLPYLSGGYSGAVYVNLPEHWSFGVLTGGQPWRDFNQTFEDFIIDSRNPDAVALRWPYAVGVEARYLFSKNNEGLFAQTGLGWEEFEVRVGDARQTRGNAYAGFGGGYQWFPWGRRGFYVLPKTGVVFLLDRSQRTLADINYRLNTAFPNAELAIGWKFGRQ